MHIECALFSWVTETPPEPPVSNLAPQSTYDGPPAPREGNLYVDSTGAFWKVKKVTTTDNPAGFYIVHMCHGPTVDDMDDSLVLGPREFAALARDRDLRTHLHAVDRR